MTMNLIRLFNTCCARSAVPQCPAAHLDSQGALSPRGAKEIFDHFANLDGMEFDHLADGCFARAHLMCSMLKDMGLLPAKAWAFRDTAGAYLNIVNENRRIEWDLHTAPVLPVRIPGAAQAQLMVFDPSLFDGPVTPLLWAQTIHADLHHCGIFPFGVTPRGIAPPDLQVTGDFTPDLATDCLSSWRARYFLSQYEDAADPPRRLLASGFRL